jgi:LacI family transcriptional regulator
MATMNDVAREAGVSVATVSAVLNQSTYVSPELTERVNQAAKRLDYRINALARSLKQGSTQTVGMLIPTFGAPDPFFGEVVQGVEITLRGKDYSLLLAQTYNRVAEQSRHIAAFRARVVDGLFLFQASGHDPELTKFLNERKPVVFVGRVPSDIKADVVATDIEAGTYMGVAHLLAKGHRRVALVTQRDSLSVREFRLKGWHAAYADHGLSPAAGLHAESELTVDGGYAATMELLRDRQTPQAIFADDLVLMIGMVRALQERGLIGKVEVLSSDDAEWLDVFHIPISTIVQPSHEVGVQAAGLFLARLQDPDRPYETILLKPKLKIREGSD